LVTYYVCLESFGELHFRPTFDAGAVQHCITIVRAIQADCLDSRQCAKVAAAANAVLGMIRRTFLCKDKELILQLYKSLVRPRLEFCIQAWRPYLKKDINVLERVHKRATKLISGLSEMGYEERLKILGLTKLETRRLRDLIAVFKILKGYENIDQYVFFDVTVQPSWSFIKVK